MGLWINEKTKIMEFGREYEERQIEIGEKEFARARSFKYLKWRYRG